MDKRKEFLDICHFKLGGKLSLPSYYQWFWGSTIERWKKEGMPPDVHIPEYFGFERMEVLPVSLGIIPTFETKIIEEDKEHQVILDADGAKKRLRGKLVFSLKMVGISHLLTILSLRMFLLRISCIIWKF